jgi:glucose/mannose-6-phosphate isomerase
MNKMTSMFDMIAAFPDQMLEALEISGKTRINVHNEPIEKIFISGMGGSGIGGDFVKSFVSANCSIPVIVSKSYETPVRIDKNTLVIISSYSGNTEETISTFVKVSKTPAKIICISSGGEIISRAKELQCDYIELPGGWPSPRACLGFSFVSQLQVLYKLELIQESVINDIRSAIEHLNSEKEEILIKAEQMASVLKSKMIVIYATDRIEPVAIRFRQQLNENSKMLAWHHIIPEMNHNELVGWRWQQDALAVLFLRNADDHPRNQARIELCKEIISHYTSTVSEIYSIGKNLIERSLFLVYLLDFVSFHLATHNKMDVLEVRVIDFLKDELSKIPKA